jgi:hypothetical protein
MTGHIGRSSLATTSTPQILLLILLLLLSISLIDSYKSINTISTTIIGKRYHHLYGANNDYRLYDKEGLKLFGISIPLVSKPTGFILNLAGI